jgi:hypothetical protein
MAGVEADVGPILGLLLRPCVNNDTGLTPRRLLSSIIFTKEGGN